MTNMDLLRTLSGCRFYREYLQAQAPYTVERATPGAQQKPRPPNSRLARRRTNRIFGKYCRIYAFLLSATAVLLVLPLWLVYPPYGKACLLGLLPMALCAFSWMLGAWWAWHKDTHILMAVTMGGIPVRIFLVVAWVWMGMLMPGIPTLALVLAMMWHWVVFTVPEIAMVYELSQYKGTARALRRGAQPRSEPAGGECQMKYELLYIRPIDEWDSLIVIRATPNLVEGKLGKQGRVIRYRGSGTIWREASTGQRCDSFTSEWLHCLWNRELNRKLEAKNCARPPAEHEELRRT